MQVPAAFVGTRYEARMRELLGASEPGVIRVGQSLQLFEAVAGARDVVKVHYATAQSVTNLPAARMHVAEVPDDEPYREMTAALLSNGFREEGRVEDFVAEGIALRILVKRDD